MGGGDSGDKEVYFVCSSKNSKVMITSLCQRERAPRVQCPVYRQFVWCRDAMRTRLLGGEQRKTESGGQ